MKPSPEGRLLCVDSLQMVKDVCFPDRSDGDTGRETLLSPENVCNECVAVK